MARDEAADPDNQGHKRNKSAVLKALVNPRSRTQSPTKSALKSPTKTKSNDIYEGNDGTVITRSPRKTTGPKDKENISPVGSMNEAAPPIWAQFASQQPSGSSPKKPDLWASSTLSNRQGPPPSPTRNLNRNSKVMAAVAMIESTPTQPPVASKELDSAFESVLALRNVPENMRQQMRGLDPKVKSDFVRHQGTPKQEPEKQDSKGSALWNTLRGRGRSVDVSRKNSVEETESPGVSSHKRSRSRGRAFGFGKGDGSPSKRARSNSRPRSLMSLRNLSSTSLSSIGSSRSKESRDGRAAPMLAGDFVDYMEEKTKPEEVEIGKIHKLRLLLRNEDVSWVDDFITFDGFNKLLGLLKRITQLEWREEHEDLLLHEVLLCLKALSTTDKGLQTLAENESTFFTDMFTMLFDADRKGPSEYNTRETIIRIAFVYLANSPSSLQESRARKLLSYIADPASSEEDQPVDFISQMKQRRPYLKWHKEVSDVTREVFWIFLHHLNVIPTNPVLDCTEVDFSKRNFPKERPPVPAAPYVGGVEWDATNYIASHLDLVNGIVASLPSQAERNALRSELQASGFEKLMGWTLRLCKEKFYCCVHDGLRTWVAAAIEDDWDVRVVRTGPTKEEMESRSPRKGASPQKEAAPPPKLELKVEIGKGGASEEWI